MPDEEREPDREGEAGPGSPAAREARPPTEAEEKAEEVIDRVLGSPNPLVEEEEEKKS